MSSSNHDAIAERYAAALFALAEQDASLPAVEQDVRALSAMIADSADLARMLKSPVLGRAQQAAAIEALSDRAGWHGLTRNFLGLVAKNRRLFALSAMIGAFLARLAAHRGEVRARIVSAQPLTDAQQKTLAESLKKAVGRAVQLELAVDARLLGGMITSVGSTRVDGSLASKLQQLTLALKGVR